MPFNASENVKSNENANLPHQSTRAIKIQQPINSFAVLTSSSQVLPLHPPEKAPESTRNAPAFPFTNPPSLLVNDTTTPSLSGLTQAKKAAGPKRKRGRPAKRFAPLPEIPSFHRLNLIPASGSGTGYGYPAAVQHVGPSSSQTMGKSVPAPTLWQPQQTPNAPADVDWGAYIRMCDQYAAKYITGVNNDTTPRYNRKIGQKSSPPNENESEQNEPARKRPRLEQTQAASPSASQGVAGSRRRNGSAKLARAPSSPLSNPPVLPSIASGTSPSSGPSFRPPLPCLPLSPVLLNPDPELEPYSDPALRSLPLPIFDAEYRPEPPMAQDAFVEALLELRGTQETFVSLNEDEIIERTAF